MWSCSGVGTRRRLDIFRCCGISGFRALIRRRSPFRGLANILGLFRSPMHHRVGTQRWWMLRGDFPLAWLGLLVSLLPERVLAGHASTIQVAVFINLISLGGCEQRSWWPRKDHPRSNVVIYRRKVNFSLSNRLTRRNGLNLNERVKENMSLPLCSSLRGHPCYSSRSHGSCPVQASIPTCSPPAPDKNSRKMTLPLYQPLHLVGERFISPSDTLSFKKTPAANNSSPTCSTQSRST